jgi:hypothetical protein
MSIAGHRNSGILYLSPVSEHSGTGLGRLIPVPDWVALFRYRTGSPYSGTGLGRLIPVPDWFRHRHFCSFRYRTDWMSDSPTFRHLKRKGYSLHIHTASVGSSERDTPNLQVVTG